MISDPKILVRISETRHISDIWFPHKGEEIGQLLMLVGLLESGFDVYVSCHDINPLPEIHDFYKDMKGNIILIDDVMKLTDTLHRYASNPNYTNLIRNKIKEIWSLWEK